MYASYTAAEIADYTVSYCIKQGKPVSNLKLQKLLFFIQSDYYAAKGRWLFDEDFQAWQYGPVVPAVYRRYSAWAGMSIGSVSPARSEAEDFRIEADDRRVINRSIDSRIEKSGWQLVAETHRDGSPWSLAYRGGSGIRSVIPKEFIGRYALQPASQR